MKALTDALSRVPTWLLWGLAPMAAAALMSMFIDTLHDSMRRGDELRQSQQVAGADTKPSAGAPVAGETAQLR